MINSLRTFRSHRSKGLNPGIKPWNFTLKTKNPTLPETYSDAKLPSKAFYTVKVMMLISLKFYSQNFFAKDFFSR